MMAKYFYMDSVETTKLLCIADESSKIINGIAQDGTAVNEDQIDYDKIRALYEVTIVSASDVTYFKGVAAKDYEADIARGAIDEPTNVQPADSFGIDAFGRSRVSNPETIFDSKQLYDSLPLFWDEAEVTGAGTSSVHSVNKACTTMLVGATTAGKIVRQTFRRFNYEPGKSQEIMATFGNLLSSSGNKKMVGYFDDNNGLFVQNDSGITSVGIRSKTSGSVVDILVDQVDWNKDKMDGTGVSGYTLDLTKTQIFFIDFEWLGVGRVRMGFVIDGCICYVHEFNNANGLDVVYMSTPNLPLRYSIENDGTGAVDDFDHICSTVITEGGTQANGILHNASTSGVHIDANIANSIYSIVGIRLKNTHHGVTVLPEYFSMLSQTADDFERMLIFNPIIAGTFTYTGIANSAVESARGDSTNTVTGGIVLVSGVTNRSTSIIQEIKNSLVIGSTIAGVSDELVLCCRPLGSNADIEGTLNRKEL